MKRRVFNLLAAISLILCLAMIGLWVRSWFAYEIFSWTSSPPTTSTSTPTTLVMWGYGHTGGVCWLFVASGPQPLLTPGFSHADFSSTTGSRVTVAEYFRRTPSHGEFAGVQWSVGPYHGRLDATEHILLIPLWYLIAAFAILPAWAGYRHFTRRPAPGLCPICGYDLRATPERCPECGTVPI